MNKAAIKNDMAVSEICSEKISRLTDWRGELLARHIHHPIVDPPSFCGYRTALLLQHFEIAPVERIAASGQHNFSDTPGSLISYFHLSNYRNGSVNRWSYRGDLDNRGSCRVYGHRLGDFPPYHGSFARQTRETACGVRDR